MTTRADLEAELGVHASVLGVEAGYWDVQGRRHEASPDSLLAVLSALGAPVTSLSDVDGPLRAHALAHRTAAVPPVVVVSATEAMTFEVCIQVGSGASSLHIDLEGGEGGSASWDLAVGDLAVTGELEEGGGHWRWHEVRVALAGVPVGSHAMWVEVAGRSHGVTLLVSPGRVVQPGLQDRLWGGFAPLYSLRTGRTSGPNVFDLDALGAWIHRHGGTVVATLPLLAAYLDRPFDPSPYSPVSRSFWNESYLDLERLPELAGSPAARALLADPSTRADLAAVAAADRFDAAAAARPVRRVLDELTTTFFAQPARRRAAFDAWAGDRPEVASYGRFRAAVERTGTGWHSWGDRQRRGALAPDDYDLHAAGRHVYAQWCMHRQLGQVRQGLRGRGQLLYLDLPVGAGGDGFDTWFDQADFAWGVSVGAPPDDFFASGQDWGFPPLRPDHVRSQGHRHLSRCLRHHMAQAGILRLDHVMGLNRLFLVPDGMDPTEGVYVRYPAEEQFAMVAIESHRAGCLVVGEDLGTVPDEVRDAMHAHGVLRSYLAEFSMPAAPGDRLDAPDRRSVASVGTHDTPPFATFLVADDIRARVGNGQLTALEGVDRIARRLGSCDALATDLAARGYGDRQLRGGTGVLRGVLEALGDSDSPLVLVSLDDLVGSTEPQNVPGTGPERPNWVRRLPDSLEDMALDPKVETTLGALRARRLASQGRVHAAGDPGAADIEVGS